MEVAEPEMLSPARVVVPNPVFETVSFPFISKRPDGLLVPTPTVPRKKEVADVVAMMFPTVSCVPVAMSAPEASVATTELLDPVNDVPLIVTVVTEPESEAVTPEPVKLSVVLAVSGDPSSCTKLYALPPVPRHVPLTVRHPPVIATPPEKVDVEVFVTIRFVTVVVPSTASPEVLIVVFVMDPPVMIGFVIVVPLKLFIIWL